MRALCYWYAGGIVGHHATLPPGRRRRRRGATLLLSLSQSMADSVLNQTAKQESNGSFPDIRMIAI
jgi:hypothetical protein